jgi:hypothetical protein
MLKSYTPFSSLFLFNSLTNGRHLLLAGQAHYNAQFQSLAVCQIVTCMHAVKSRDGLTQVIYLKLANVTST